jgi:sigma-E factor negative regulatory protein RseA
MNEKKLEALSALMDGESFDSDSGSLHGWTRDEGLRATWGRYHIISDCIRGTLPRYLDTALADRIAMALRSEPAILAPDRVTLRPWLKPLAGMAIAASVATLAVVGIQISRTDTPGAGIGQSVASQLPATSGGSGGQLNLAAGNGVTRPIRPVDPARRRADSRLNRYLINYNEQRSNDAVQGMPPFVRVIVEGQDPQP